MAKRLRPATNGFDASKRYKEMEATDPSLGSKTKPCTKFFSTTGCSFGDACHFLHYVPDGKPFVPMSNQGIQSFSARNPTASHPHSNASASPTVKTRMCNKFGTPEGCKFGDNCRYAHGPQEIGRPYPSMDGPMAPPAHARSFGGYHEPLPPASSTPGGFGASATAKISVDASLAGLIIGKGGMHSKHISRSTGVRLSVKDIESDASHKNIELEGTFDQIKEASAMVRELILNIGATKMNNPPVTKVVSGGYKTKICEHFTRGSCTFANRCHFAHGENELRNAAV